MSSGEFSFEISGDLIDESLLGFLEISDENLREIRDVFTGSCHLI